MNTRDRTPIALVAGLAVLATITVACVLQTRSPAPSAAPPTTSREGGVVEHSKEVMPFDLTRATHTFGPTADGLIETVTSNLPPDPAQVALIHGHLAAEATAFGAGDFDDPAKIHGDDMPGLTELRANPGGLTVRYDDVPDGGRITYTATDPILIDALHRFGDAQSADHGH
jgi:hypothetical protein